MTNPYVGKVKSRILGPWPTVGTDNWRSREIWLESTLKNIPAGKRILDAGAGESRYKSFCKHLTYVSQDFGQYDGVGTGVGIQTGSWDQSNVDILCDITCIPEPDASFEAIMCVEVLEHLPDPVAALREFSRLLTHEGVLILTAPFYSKTHLAPYYFHSGFSRYFYEKWLPELGFEIVEIVNNGNFFKCLAQEIQELPSVAGRYCANSVLGGPRRRLRELARRILLNWLSEMSEGDMGSDESFAFGLQICAIRRRDK